MVHGLLRALGVFYAFGGVLVLLRLDRAGGVGAGGHWTLRYAIRALLLALGGVLTCVGGVALAALSKRALLVMGVNTLVQFAWVGFAAAALAPRDDAERETRRQSLGAACSYAVVFALLVWLQQSERAQLTDSGTMDQLIAALTAAMLLWQAVAAWRWRTSVRTTR